MPSVAVSSKQILFFSCYLTKLNIIVLQIELFVYFQKIAKALNISERMVRNATDVMT